MAASAGSFQQLVATAGSLPFTEGLMLGRLMRLCLPGLCDVQYAESDAELAAYLATKRGERPTTA